MLILLIVVLLLMSVGGAPNWGWHHFGYWPSGLTLVLVVVVVFVLLRGRL